MSDPAAPLTAEEMANALEWARETAELLGRFYLPKNIERPANAARALLQLAAQVAEQKVDLAQRLGIATDMQQRAEAAEAKVARLLETLRELLSACTAEVNEKGAGGYLLARMSDASDVIKSAEADAIFAALAPSAPQPEVKP